MDEFKRINMETTSEMFLSILILLQNSLPCTENFYRYQKNFEKYISNEGGNDGNAEAGAGGQVKTIASPRVMSNSPLASLAKQHGINFNPSGTKNMLNYAANRQQPGAEAGAGGADAPGNEGELNLGGMRTAK